MPKPLCVCLFKKCQKFLTFVGHWHEGCTISWQRESQSMFSISSSGRCEGYQIQILAFPTPDGCDAIGEGDGTETDASSTSWEEVDTISVHTSGAQLNFGAPSSMYTMCLWGGRGSAFYYVRVVGLPTVSSDWNQIILHFLKTHKTLLLSFKLALAEDECSDVLSQPIHSTRIFLAKTNGGRLASDAVSLWRVSAKKEAGRQRLELSPARFSPPSLASPTAVNFHKTSGVIKNAKAACWRKEVKLWSVLALSLPCMRPPIKPENDPRGSDQIWDHRRSLKKCWIRHRCSQRAALFWTFGQGVAVQLMTV